VDALPGLGQDGLTAHVEGLDEQRHRQVVLPAVQVFPGQREQDLGLLGLVRVGAELAPRRSGGAQRQQRRRQQRDNAAAARTAGGAGAMP
jgi:hypothetical protein